MDPLLVTAANLVCWGSIAIVWIGGGMYNAVRAAQPVARGSNGRASTLLAIALAAVTLIVGRSLGESYLAVDVIWVEVAGLAVLVASTLFALWARLSLGTSWSIDARVGGDRRLRTSGPYSITRHPIYTGLLGMLLGSSLLAGLGMWVVLVPLGLIVFELRIRLEERLLLATFGDDYVRYRRDVPQLIPGLRLRGG